MIIGTHVIIYSRDAKADRAFFRDVLHFPAVDAGEEWLIFRMPASETAFHPHSENNVHELYLMCDDLNREMSILAAAGVTCAPIQEERWGRLTKLALPGGGVIGLYQPKHPTALSLPL
jgi:catechol 2,3-dioxygenase-like lactoylglutathione lyase family enzyme